MVSFRVSNAKINGHFFCIPIPQVQDNWRNRLQSTWSGSLLEAYCQQVKTCTEIALNCLEPDRHKRPGIAEIILRLNEMETMIVELKNDADGVTAG